MLAALADNAGDLWVAFRDVGVVHISRADFERASRDVSFRLPVSHIYSTSDGTAGPPFDSHAASGAPDGSLWFVTRRGVTIFDPRSLAATRPAPFASVRVEELVTGDGHAYHAKDSALTPGTNRIRIDYGSTNPAAFDLLRFRYRLDGVDAGWIDAGGRRQAVYTNLAPGAYRFRVQAAEGPGAWPDDVTDWSFSIEPKFYQARWFYCASAITVLFVVVSGWRLRSRALRRKVEAVYAERLRISREIHDTLLQSLVGTTLQLDAASHDLPAHQSTTRSALLAMRRQMEDYIVEARRSIWDLRSPSLEIHDLVSAMRASGERLTRGKVAFSLSVAGVPRRCQIGGSQMYDLVIRNGTLVDGTGLPKYRADVGVSGDRIAAIGVACAGEIRPNGLVVHAPNLGWRDVPLGATLADAFSVPVVVENDVRAAAWGEFRFGAGRGAQSLITAGKIFALLAGRFNVSKEDLNKAMLPALRHRILLNFEAEADGMTPDSVLSEVLAAVDAGDKDPIRV